MAARQKTLLVNTDCGLYCPAGDFYIDPWKPVERAVVTHAHTDHARWGMGRYLCSDEAKGVMRIRLGTEAKIDSVPFGQSVSMGSAKVSLHPAGHILGSAQIRVEQDGYVAVVSGDYKTEPDATCSPFELLKCHLFVTESTFGLPIYRWCAEEDLVSQINSWWAANQKEGKTSILLGYALGKAQRALARLDPSIGPIFLHGAVHRLTQAYREAGIDLPPTKVVYDVDRKYPWSNAILLAPPSANGTPWLRRFGDISTAFMSGWMAIRGARRRRAVDRGFVLSDHADWPSLLRVIGETGAEKVWVTHGYTNVLSRYLNEAGTPAEVLQTQWEGEQDAAGMEVSEEASEE